MIRKFLNTLLVLQLVGCAFAPFATTPTARTNAAGQHAVQGALVEGKIPSFRYEYGLLGNLDVGAEGEMGFGTYTLGINTKFALPNAQGFSNAAILGIGKNLLGDGNYWYLGPVVSYKMTYFEPAFILRYTDSASDDVDFNQSTGGITFSGEHLRYWYMVLSATFYPTQSVGIVLQASDAMNVKGGGNITDGMIYTMGLQFKM